LRAELNAYRDSIRIRTLLAAFLWRQGRHKDAATLFESSPYRISESDWQVLGKAFAEAFRDRPIKEALAAFSALRDVGIHPRMLVEMAKPVAQNGQHELAFKMVSPLGATGTLAGIMLLTEAYDYLKAWQGKEKALEWLRTAVPPDMPLALDAVAMAAGGVAGTGEKRYELLWAFIPLKPQHFGADFIWLLRAAVAARLGLSTDPHRDELLKYFGRPAVGPYHQIGRYLLGMISEAEVLSLATDGKKRCEVAYYLGVRAQAEGRYEDASDWYRVSIETGLNNNGEYVWAFETLAIWNGKGKSLAQLAAEGT